VEIRSLTLSASLRKGTKTPTVSPTMSVDKGVGSEGVIAAEGLRRSKKLIIVIASSTDGRM
jgi:hypothetical protein